MNLLQKSALFLSILLVVQGGLYLLFDFDLGIYEIMGHHGMRMVYGTLLLVGAFINLTLFRKR